MYDNPRMSDQARDQIQVLVSFFESVRSGGGEFMAMLVPVGFGVASCAIALMEGMHPIQVAAAACTLRERHHPTEVIWISDIVERVVKLSAGEKIPDLPPSQDPLSSESMDVGYCRNDGGVGRVPVVDHHTCPYRWNDRGEFEFRPQIREFGWVAGRSRVDAAIAAAVWEQLPEKIRPPTATELAKLRVSYVSEAEFS